VKHRNGILLGLIVFVGFFLVLDGARTSRLSGPAHPVSANFFPQQNSTNGFSWIITSKTVLTNARFDENGAMIVGSVDHAFFVNGTEFQASVNGYSLGSILLYDSEGNLQISPISNDEMKPVLDLVPLAENMNKSMSDPFFWLGLFVAFCILFRSYYYMLHEPYIKLRNMETLQMKNIGRYIREIPLRDGGLYKYTFKTISGVKEFYGDRSFSEYQPFCFERFAGIFHYYPDLVLHEISVPENIKLESRKIAHTWQNMLLAIPYAICSMLQLISWSIRLYSQFEFIGERVEKIPFLFNICLTEQLDIHLDIKYEKFELNQKGSGIEEWIPHQEKNTNISELFAIMKNDKKIRNLVYENVVFGNVKYNNVVEAIRDRRSRLFERAFFESRKIYYEKQVSDSFNLYQQVAEQMTTLKITEEERFHDAFSKIDALNTDRNNSLPELLSQYTRNRQLGMDESDAIQRAVMAKIDDDYGQDKKILESENAELKGKIALYQELLKNKLQNSEKNTINVRSEFPESSIPEE